MLAAALPASAAAHVTLTPARADPGEVAALSFRVPNERPDARTVRVEIFLPEGQPVGSVRVRPRPGWRAVRHADPLPEVDWNANGDGIGPGEAATFTMRVGPLPHAERLLFKTLQHYSDGRVVRWIQEPTPGEDRPPRPAPTLLLAAPADEGGGTTWWPIVAGLGALALLVGVVVWWRRR